MRLIDADALWKQMKEFREKRDEEANMTGDRAVCVTWNDAVIFVKNAPTIDAVPVKHAKLVNPNPFGECSICGYLIDIRQEYHYCPNCGAKMDGGEDDETPDGRL